MCFSAVRVWSMFLFNRRRAGLDAGNLYAENIPNLSRCHVRKTTQTPRWHEPGANMPYINLSVPNSLLQSWIFSYILSIESTSYACPKLMLRLCCRSRNGNKLADWVNFYVGIYRVLEIVDVHAMACEAWVRPVMSEDRNGLGTNIHKKTQKIDFILSIFTQALSWIDIRWGHIQSRDFPVIILHFALML